MPKFRKRPVVIEAEQFDGTVACAIRIEAWANDGRVGHIFADRDTSERAIMLIATLEGNMEGRPQDWIIKGVNGEFYPCKADIFEKTYEAVAE